MTESPHYYYAYGSNMSTSRLVERIPEALPLGAASIAGYRLRCNKLGADGSGKANLVLDTTTVAWGVAFEVPAATWRTLDGFEVGYERVGCSVVHAHHGEIEAQMYLALEPGHFEVSPFEWYLEHMTRGASEHGLPDEYQEAIAAWQTRTAG